jgi:hypothetical protein
MLKEGNRNEHGNELAADGTHSGSERAMNLNRCKDKDLRKRAKNCKAANMQNDLWVSLSKTQRT